MIKRKTCCNCSEKINRLHLYINDSKDYCQECFVELIFKCNNCNKHFLKDNSYTGPNDDLICEDCYSELCFVCDDCNSTKWSDDCNAFNNSYYCNDCIGDHAVECNGCNELVSTDNSYTCDNCSEFFGDCCSADHGCESESESESDNFEEQNQKLDFQDGKKTSIITVDRFVGVELEAENGDREALRLPDSFGIKEDGSLNESGVEIVTPPSKKSALVKNIKLACEQLNKNGFEATKSAGLHVHIDLRDIKDNFIKLSRIMRTFYAIEDVMFSILPEARRNSSYCYPLRSKFNFYDFYGSKLANKFDEKLYQETDKTIIADRKN